MARSNRVHTVTAISHVLTYGSLVVFLGLACDSRSSFDEQVFQQAHARVVDRLVLASPYGPDYVTDYRHLLERWTRTGSVEETWEKIDDTCRNIDTVLLVETSCPIDPMYELRAILKTTQGGCLLWAGSGSESIKQLFLFQMIDSLTVSRLATQLAALYDDTSLVDDLTIIGEDGCRDFVTIRSNYDSIAMVAVANLIMAPVQQRHRYAPLQLYLELVFGRAPGTFERRIEQGQSYWDTLRISSPKD